MPKKYKIFKEELKSKLDKKEIFDDPVSLNTNILIKDMSIPDKSDKPTDKRTKDKDKHEPIEDLPATAADSDEDDDLLWRAFNIAKRKPKRHK